MKLSISYIILAAFCFSSFVCKAQRDTIIVYDTIFEVKEPLIIFKPENKTTPDFFQKKWIGLKAGSGVSRYNHSTQLKGKHFTEFCLETGWNYRNSPLFSAIGISFQRFKDQYNWQENHQTVSETDYIDYDTIGSYVHIINNQEHLVYVVDEIHRTRTDTASNLISHSKDSRSTFLYVPLITGINFSIKKFGCMFFLSGGPAFKISGKEDYSGSGSRIICQYGAGGEISYQVITGLSFLVRCETRTTRSFITNHENITRNQWPVSVGIKYFL
jgi:hypothetical protein